MNTAQTDDQARRRNRSSSTERAYLLHSIDAAAEQKALQLTKQRRTAQPGPRIVDARFVSPRLRGLTASWLLADITQPTLVTDHILIGNREDAMDQRKLETLGVSHVLNSCKQLPNYHPSTFVYHKLPLRDAPDYQIVECRDVAVAFLQRVECLGGRAFVHCIAGSSRSVAVVIMHLMVAHRVPLLVAYAHIVRMRPQANPNEGFKLQLALLEVELFGSSSVANPNAGRAWSFYEWNIRKPKVPRHHVSIDARAPTSVACVLQ